MQQTNDFDIVHYVFEDFFPLGPEHTPSQYAVLHLAFEHIRLGHSGDEDTRPSEPKRTWSNAPC
jgi:hypothetical protein